MRALRTLGARQELHFLLVGGLNTLVGLGLFAGLDLLLGERVHYLVTLLLTYALGTLFAFGTQRRFVFRVRGQALADLARFTMVQLGALALNAVALGLLVEVVGLPVLAAQVVALALVTVSTYFAHLLFSFRRTPPRAPSPQPPDGSAGRFRAGRDH